MAIDRVEQIRFTPLTVTANVEEQAAASMADCSVFLREIAAQLGQLNEHLREQAADGKAALARINEAVARMEEKVKEL